MILVLVILVALLVLAVIVMAGLLTLNRQPTSGESEHLADRADDLQRYGENLERLVALYSDKLTALAERKVNEMATLLNAAHEDRDRLLTAVLALTSPTAAVTVGRIDAASAKAQTDLDRTLTMRQFMDETAGRDTEFATSEGETIHPVGMGG